MSEPTVSQSTMPNLPARYKPRWPMPLLSVDELWQHQIPDPKPILLVKVNEDIKDGRPGYDPSKPVDDSAILARVEKSWALQKHMDEWIKKPELSPGLLLGVFGKPGEQFIIASLVIDQNNWRSAKRDGERFIVPILQKDEMDAFKLRFRRIRSDAKIGFNITPDGECGIIDSSKRFRGGHSSW